MKTMKIVAFAILWMCLINRINAQKYGNTLGLRLGNGAHKTIGMSFEQRLFKHVSFEGIFQSDLSRNTLAHGLIKHHHPALGKRLNLYTGAGMSFGIEESIQKNPTNKELVTTYGNSTLGADLVAGAELTLLGLTVSLDYKPNFNLVGRDNWYQGQVGVSLRKVLLSDKELKKKRRKKEREKRRKDRQSRSKS